MLIRILIVTIVVSISTFAVGQKAGASAAGESAGILYPAPPGVKPSRMFEVQVDGAAAFVYSCQVGTIYDKTGKPRKDPPERTDPTPAAFCNFGLSGEVEITVKVLGDLPNNSVIIRPLRHQIKAEIKDNLIKFRIREPGQYSVERNGSPIEPLYLFANPPEHDVPAKDDPNVLYFGPGEHVIGWKSIKQGQNVYLAPGAVVYGHFIVGNTSGTRIYGRGILDASRSPRKGNVPSSNEFGKRDVQIHIGHCKNATIEGITILDSPAWTLHIVRSEDVVVKNVKIITWRENGDGIDVNNSQRVTVLDSFLRTWDDALVVKASIGPDREGKSKPRDAQWTPADLPLYERTLTKNISFSNCVVWLDRAHALEIGFETNASEISNIVFENIDVIHDNHLAVIDITNGDSARIHKVRFENIRIEDTRADVHINLLAGNCYTSIDDQMGLDYGVIENVRIKDINFTGKITPRIVMEGQSIDPTNKQAKVRGITIEEIKINGKILKPDDQMIERKGQVDPVKWTR